MTPAQEWQNWRVKRERGEVTAQQWITWADAYVQRLGAGPWRKHCEAHIRFVKRQVQDGRA